MAHPPQPYPLICVNLAPQDPGTALVVPVAGELPPPFASMRDFLEELDAVCDVRGGLRRVLFARVTGDWRRAGARAIAAALREPSLALDLNGVAAADGAAFIEGACLRAWRDERWRTRGGQDAPRLGALRAFGGATGLVEAWGRRAASVESALFARDLVSEPSNTLTPEGFVARLSTLVNAGVELTVLRGAALHEAGLSGLLAVGGGSSHPPLLAVLRWTGAGGAPLAFVGKGITFDTGGICIKPADEMWEMRADMAGAAACAGAMLALARRGSAASVIAVLALAENATSGASYRPSDVLTHADGTTIEIIDTDAEGRLMLADALGWAVRNGARAVIDLATLTGSVVVALGHERAGVFSNDDALAAQVHAAGEAVGERVWRLPIDDSHRAALDSDIADLRHCSPERGQPDACQAAAFLRHFVGVTPWVHLDIAGVESRAEAAPEHAAGATGFGVRLLDRLVADAFE